MQMLTASDLDSLEHEVDAAESRTSVEIVMVTAGQSGSYTDLDLWAGIIASQAALLLILFTPWEFPLLSIVPLLLVSLIVGMAVSQRVPAFRRLLCLRDRMARQAADGAGLAFMRFEVGATRDRSGLLLYYTALEDRLVLVPDVAIKGRVPGHRLVEIAHRFQSSGPATPLAPRLGKAVQEIVEAVHAEFPPSAANPDEIPNRPRVIA